MRCLSLSGTLGEIGLAAGVASMLLAGGLMVVGFAARTFGFRVAPVVVLGGVGAVGAASAIAAALTA